VATEKLLAAFLAVQGEIGRGLHFSPVVDGRTLSHHPWDPVAPPESEQVPCIFGCTLDETVILLGGLSPERDVIFRLDETGLHERVARYLGIDAERTGTLVAAYRGAHPRHSPSDLFFAITSDHMMRIPSILQAERKAAQPGAPSYLYLFTWPSDLMGAGIKAHHGAELPFVFDTVDEDIERLGAGPDRRVLADQMRGAWAQFARTGDPNHSGLPNWPSYSKASRDTMIFDMPSRVEPDPGSAGRIAMTPWVTR